MKKQLLKTFFSVGIPALLVLCAFLIFFFAKGYRFDFRDGEIERTGVISVKTDPKKAHISIDGEYLGTSPHTFSGIATGTHTVLVEKEGYYSWSSKVTLEAEHLIPFEVELFLKEPPIEQFFPISSTDQTQTTRVLSLVRDEENNTAFFASHITPIIEDQPATNEIAATTTLQIYSYPLSRYFWETEAEPILIAEFTSDLLGVNIDDPSTYTLQLLPAPNGDLVLFSLVATSSDATATYFLLTTATLNETPTLVPALASAGNITWSKDSQYILFTRANELRSLNTSTQAQVVLVELPQNDTESVIWTTNNDGTLVAIERNNAGTSLFTIPIEGSNPTILINYPTPTETEQAPGNTTETTDGEVPIDSTDATAIYNMLSQAQSITTLPDNSKLAICTSTSLVLYSLNGNQLTRYEADNPEFTTFSPEDTSLIYRDSHDQYFELWLDPENIDPFHEQNPRALISAASGSTISSILWYPSPWTLLFSTTLEGHSFLYGFDTQSLTSFRIAEIPAGSGYAIDSSGEHILTFCEEDTLCLITVRE